MTDYPAPQYEHRRYKLPEPLERKDVYFYRLGREALLEGLLVAGACPGDGVLLPDYFCAEVSAFLEHSGLRIAYYRIKKDLTPDESSVVRCIDVNTRFLVTVHFFGFPCPVVGLADICRQNNLVCVEDNAHGLLSSHAGNFLGTTGDIGIFSFRKTLPVKDGAALIINNPGIKKKPINNAPLPRISAAQHYAWRFFDLLLQHSPIAMRLAAGIKKKYYNENPEADESRQDVAQAQPCQQRLHGMSARAWHRLLTADYSRILHIRRTNYMRLAEWLAEDSECHILFPDLADGICPQVMPVLSKDAQKLIACLRANGIGARHWPDLPDQVIQDQDRHSDALFLRNHIVTLPIEPFYQIKKKNFQSVQRLPLLQKIKLAYSR